MVDNGLMEAAVSTLGEMVTVAVLLLYELPLRLNSIDSVLVPELMVEVANSPLLIWTAVPDAMVCAVAEVGNVMPFAVLEPTIPPLVTFVVMAIPR